MMLETTHLIESIKKMISALLFQFHMYLITFTQNLPRITLKLKLPGPPFTNMV